MICAIFGLLGYYAVSETRTLKGELEKQKKEREAENNRVKQELQDRIERQTLEIQKQREEIAKQQEQSKRENEERVLRMSSQLGELSQTIGRQLDLLRSTQGVEELLSKSKHNGIYPIFTLKLQLQL